MKKRLLLVVAALLVLATAVVMSELQEPPRHTPEPTAPLTDVAGPSPEVTVSTGEEPHQRLTDGSRPPPSGQPEETGTTKPVPEAPPARVVLPALMPDPAHPPQWTKPLALPSTPSPPDPMVPPPIAVDPERGRPQGNEERRAP